MACCACGNAFKRRTYKTRHATSEEQNRLKEEWDIQNSSRGWGLLWGSGVAYVGPANRGAYSRFMAKRQFNFRF